MDAEDQSPVDTYRCMGGGINGWIAKWNNERRKGCMKGWLDR